MIAKPDEHGDVELFIRLNQIGAGLGALFVTIVNAFFLQVGEVWSVVVVLALLNVALVVAAGSLGAGHLLRSLIVVAAGNWFVAVAMPLLLPFLWPVMALTVLMPLVLASPHLSRGQIVPAIVSAAVLAAAVATIGLLNDDGGVIEDVDDAIELIVVIGALSAQIVPIGLVVWQHNQMQRANVGSLELLNTELVSSEAALAASRARVVRAADTERRRIERDLHDGAQQRLVALGVRLRLLQSQGHDDPVVGEGIKTLIEELDGAISEVRELAHGIYPPLLQTRGLPDAITAVARRSPLDVELDVEPIARLPEAVETALYFTALEALTNAAKHAPGATVELSLTTDADRLTLRVCDDGPGFDPSTAAASHGFNNMRDRLAVVGGDVTVGAKIGGGTEIVATVAAVERPADEGATRVSRG